MSIHKRIKHAEDYIKHEVELRVHSQKFKDIERVMMRIDGKIGWLISTIIFSVMLPVALHLFKLI